MTKSSLNRITLAQLRNAPASQLSKLLKMRCMACDESNENEIKSLFAEIYYSSDEERNAFVAQLVSPEFTQNY